MLLALAGGGAPLDAVGQATNLPPSGSKAGPTHQLRSWWTTVKAGESPALLGRVVFVQIPVQHDIGPSLALGARISTAALPLESRIVSFDPSLPGSGPTVLTPAFAAAGFPELSFDGERILFVGKKTVAGPFHVWEMNTDGSGVRQVTGVPSLTGWTSSPGAPGAGPTAGRPAVYLSTIYTMDADAPVDLIAFSSDQDGGTLYTCHLDGTRVSRITFNPYGVSDPLLLSDGRLLLSYGSPPVARNRSGAGVAEGGGTALLTINTDGTDIFAFAGMHEPAAIRAMPCETSDGWVVYVESDPDSSDGGGALMAVARTRSLYTRRVIADDPAGLYHSPSALPAAARRNPGRGGYVAHEGTTLQPAARGRLLVSYRKRTGGSYGVHVLDRRTGRRIAEVYDDPQWHEVDALLLRPRPRPRGRSSVVDQRAERGWLYCIDAYLSDGKESKRIEAGRIKRLRVFVGLRTADFGLRISDEGSIRNRQSAIRNHDPAAVLIEEEILGEVPVESDGSFFVEVPARIPLRLETLDAEGEVLQRMSSWIWVMPREARGCIGCHEDRELTPPNRHTLALRKAAHKLRLPAED